MHEVTKTTSYTQSHNNNHTRRHRHTQNERELSHSNVKETTASGPKHYFHLTQDPFTIITAKKMLLTETQLFRQDRPYSQT